MGATADRVTDSIDGALNLETRRLYEMSQRLGCVVGMSFSFGHFYNSTFPPSCVHLQICWDNRRVREGCIVVRFREI